MADRDNLLCSGNLIEELHEMELMISRDDYIEIPGSTTLSCATFLTLYCC